MLLVQAGMYTINVDNVSVFIDEGDEIVVVFNTPYNSTAKEPSYSIRIEGEACELLRSWLKNNAEGIRQEPPGFLR